ncbi:hypothetical protein EHO59_10980, partial [Leptospira semungkisensis]
IKYIAIVSISKLRTSGYASPEVEKFIVSNYDIPTEGTWLQLLKISLKTLRDKDKSWYSLLYSNHRSENTRSFLQRYFLFINKEFNNKDTFNTVEYFEYLIKLKNNLVSHSLIPEETAESLNSSLLPLLKDIISFINPVFEIPVLYIDETSEGEYESVQIAGLATSIDPAKLSQNYTEEGIYLFVNDSLVSLRPLMVLRDGNILLYNRFEIQHKKIQYHGPGGKGTYIKTSAQNIQELFDIDYSLFGIKPLQTNVRKSKTGILHNVPDPDFKEFVGRKEELLELEKCIAHRRHYLTALDGIGGVGKTAISLKFCHNILLFEKSSELYFEYIIWVSAKNTVLKNGKISPLTQAFEHLNQLLDIILEVTGFHEYKEYDQIKKTKVIYQIAEETRLFIIIDNLETIRKDNLKAIWDFLYDLPLPTKVLLTSREFHFDVNQHVNINNLSYSDSSEFISNYCLSTGLQMKKIEQYSNEIISLSSGLPIALSSILGQIYLGKSFASIKNAISKNEDDLTKFCFEGQYKLLDEDHRKILLLFCLSTDDLNHDALSYILEGDLKTSIFDLTNQLKALSLITVVYNQEIESYTVLPLIKKYILFINTEVEKVSFLEEKLKEFYHLKDIESYKLFVVEERSIDKGSLIPRKISDKAMKHAEFGEIEEADTLFKKVTKDYPNESYVWYIYSIFQSQYKNNLQEAILCLRKANEAKPNYLYLKHIGDNLLKQKNFDLAIKSYKDAREIATVERNRDEMLYSLSNAEYEKVKMVRRNIKIIGKSNKYERNECYRNIINNLDSYLSKVPQVYDGKMIKICRMYAESYLGLGQNDKFHEYIDEAIVLSENDPILIEYKNKFS